MKLGFLSFSSGPVVMGILNLSPDSFYDGGKYNSIVGALARAEEMQSEGAGIIDIGGESTRPGAKQVSLQEELDRVIPVVESLAKRLELPISIDTSSPEVMEAAVKNGAKIINDVRALSRPGALEMAAKLDVPVCIMHMQNEPSNMQISPKYHSVITEVLDFLQDRATKCIAAGIDPQKIIIDPGFGFGKTLEHNLALLRSLGMFKNLGYQVLVGLSNKSMIGQILDVGIQNRVYGSVAAALIAMSRGADIVRVHDVRPTVDAMKVYMAVLADS